MKRHLSTAKLALCATLFAVALLPVSAFAAGPKAVVAEPIHDAGVAPKGDKISHDFQIRNEGDAPLEITEVRAACGCTVASFDRTVAPGQAGKVNVVIDTATFNGPIAKGVTVFTNDPDNPQIELTVRASVEPFIKVKPGYARYITVQGEPQKGDIVQNLWAPDGSPVEIQSIDSPYPYLKVTYREATPEERLPEAKGKQWRIEMLLDHDKAEVGALVGFVVVHVDHPRQKLVQIPVSGFVRPVIAVTPPTADFGSMELKEPRTTSLNVRAFSTEPIHVTKVDVVKGMEAVVEALVDGREYKVQLTFKPEMAKGPVKGTITIYTDSPKTPVIEIPLSGTIL